MLKCSEVDKTTGKCNISGSDTRQEGKIHFLNVYDPAY